MSILSQGVHWALGMLRVCKTDQVLALRRDKVYSRRRDEHISKLTEIQILVPLRK